MIEHEFPLETLASRLKIQSKKLASGKCQVKFVLKQDDKAELYGYLLSDSSDTLREVVQRIQDGLEQKSQPDRYFHAHLFDVGRRKQMNNDIIIFDLP